MKYDNIQRAKHNVNAYMQQAVDAARRGAETNQGGPFGAVIVKDGQVIAVAHNEVLATNDPTAHAEVVAIRRASEVLGRFDLSDCEIYSTCEPCPMCLFAIHWARIPKLFFGADRHDAALGGFDDDYCYKMMLGDCESPLLAPTIVDREPCRELFLEWSHKPDRTMY